MNFYIVYQSDEMLQCGFATIIVKNEAIIRSYRGGMKEFMEKHGARCNRHIAVACFMGDEVDDCYRDLVENGLISDDDFVFCDFGRYVIAISLDPDRSWRSRHSHTMEMPVDWLKAKYLAGDVYVGYGGPSRKAHDPVPGALPGGNGRLS